MTKKKSKLIWQRQEDRIIYNPPRSHPCYDEWQKLKKEEQEKEKEDDR